MGLENIRIFMTEQKITLAKLSEMTGIPVGTLNKIVYGITKGPTLDNMYKIALALGKTLDDFADPLPNSPTAAGSADGAGTGLHSPSKGVSIPVLGRVPAGVPVESIEDVIDWEEIPRSWTAGGKEFFGLRVAGDSMLPEYRDGDIIIARRAPDCESGQDAVVFVNGYDATLKRVVKREDGILLQPLNPDFEPMLYRYDDPENPVVIVGVVEEIRRRR